PSSSSRSASRSSAPGGSTPTRRCGSTPIPRRSSSPRSSPSPEWRPAVAALSTAARAAPALVVEGLSYAYAGAGERALEAVSLEVGAGEFVLLAGRSASGKSSLLRAACGLVPHFHGGEIEGRVAVAGLDAIATGPGELAAVVGYLAQDPESQVVSTTVAAEVGLPLEMRGDPPS